MIRVIVAFMLREITVRFGRNKFGILWALAEPCVYVAGFLVVRSVLGTSVPFGESIVLFVLSGLLFFRMFSSVASRGLGAIYANRALLSYPPVKPIDVVLARLLLEILIMYFVFAIFLLGLALTAETTLVFHPQTAFAAVGGLTILSFGVGVFNAVFATLYKSWERIWRMVRLPILLLSAVFYLPESLPPFMQQIIMLNPLLHAIEWMREGVYLTYTSNAMPEYVLIFGMTTLALGLFLESTNRSRLQAL